MKHWTTFAAAGFIAAATIVPAQAADISGAGATFPYPIYAKWADAYKKETGNGLNYQSIGSGGGIKQIKAKTVTFGASDMPLQPEELDKIGCIQFPTVMGGIVPVVNLAGIKPGELVIDGPTLAKMYLGEIKKWNDPALEEAQSECEAARPRRSLVVHRSDGSGTTFIFTNYLSNVSAEWKSKVGANTSVEWPVGIGAKGNEGVANNVGNTKGCDRLCRIRLRHAEQADLHQDGQQGRQDRKRRPRKRFQAAAADADWKSCARLRRDPHRSRRATKSWPMTGATFILVPQATGGSGRHRRSAQVLRLGL